MTTSPDTFVGTAATRRRLNVSHPTLIRLIRSGELPAIDVSTTPGVPRYRIREADIQKFIQTRAVTPNR